MLTSRCLHVTTELGVADALADQPQSTEALAKATGSQPQALYRVLRLLASVAIVMMALPGGMERRHEEYAALASKCGLRLKRMVETASPYSILEMVAA